jgi:hypothetical protein
MTVPRESIINQIRSQLVKCTLSDEEGRKGVAVRAAFQLMKSELWKL